MTMAPVRLLAMVLVAGLAGLFVTVYALAGRADPSAITVDVCVKPNGQLRVLTERHAACAELEQESSWNVGGEVTEVVPGSGLVGGGTEGLVTLAVEPRPAPGRDEQQGDLRLLGRARGHAVDPRRTE